VAAIVSGALGAALAPAARAGVIVPPAGRVQAEALPPSPPTVTPPARRVAQRPLPRDAAALAAAKQRAELRALQAPTPGESSPAPKVAVVGGLNQAGLAAGDNAATHQGTPSDSTGAIGPSHYVEFVNSKVAVYDRSNLSRLATADLDAFVNQAGDNVFDPQIQWDQQGGRWFYLAVDQTAKGKPVDRLAFGWSKTSDPTDLATGWCKYSMTTSPVLDDFPKLGHDDTHLLFGTNAYSNGITFITARIWSLPKPAPGPETTCPVTPPTATIFGSPASPLRDADGTLAFTPVAANTADASPVGYLMSAYDPTQGPAHNLVVWHVSGPAGSPSLTRDGDVAVPDFVVPASAPQPGTSSTLDTSDTRLDQVVAHADPTAGGAEALWAQHTVDGPGGRSVVRWYEVLPGNLAIQQQGTISDPANFVFNGAISPDSGGAGAAIDYNVGGAAQLAQVRAQSHPAGSAPGTMQSEVTVATSAAADQDFSCPTVGSAPPCRWGDYAAATPDPVAASTVWGTSMLNGPAPAVAGNPQWVTQNFAMSTGAAPAAAFTATRRDGARATIAFDASGSSEPGGTIASYAWDFGDGPSGAGVAPTHSYAAFGTYTVTLTVTDANGAAAAVTHPVTVANRPPSAAFRVRPAAPVRTQLVTFDGSASSDPDGPLGSYAWSFGDGARASGPRATHRFAARGAYTVALTVTDADGATASTSQTLTVGRGGVPIVQTRAATLLQSRSARLNGIVDTRGEHATARFEYGLTRAYGSRVRASTPTEGTGPVHADLRRLRPGRTYHYRLLASNADGRARGADRTFRTPRAQSRIALRVRVIGRQGSVPTALALTGSIGATGGVSAASCTRTVAVRLTAGSHGATFRLRPARSCRFAATIAVPSSLQRPGGVRVQVVYPGSAELAPGRSVLRLVG
jgi:PKD repeat protein